MDYPTRIAVNGPTTAIYHLGNLPLPGDPGWGSWRGADGAVVRLIEVHGPFAVRGVHGPEERCEDGWLGVTPDGGLLAVDSVYDGEVARPAGYTQEAS